jgi:hypothetical protein
MTLHKYRIPVVLEVYAVAPRVAAKVAGLLKAQPWGDRIQITLGEPQLVQANVEDPWVARRRKLGPPSKVRPPVDPAITEVGATVRRAMLNEGPLQPGPVKARLGLPGRHGDRGWVVALRQTEGPPEGLEAELVLPEVPHHVVDNLWDKPGVVHLERGDTSLSFDATITAAYRIREEGAVVTVQSVGPYLAGGPPGVLKRLMEAISGSPAGEEPGNA